MLLTVTEAKEVTSQMEAQHGGSQLILMFTAVLTDLESEALDAFDGGGGDTVDEAMSNYIGTAVAELRQLQADRETDGRAS